MDRRNFLKVGGAAGAALLVPPQVEKALAATSAKARAAPGVKLSMFTELLPAMAPPAWTTAATILDPYTGQQVPYYTIPVMRNKAYPHARLLGGIDVFGYGGLWPSKTLEARRGKPFFVNWQNQLSGPHILASSIDYGTGGPVFKDYMGIANLQGNDLRIVTHLHGGHVPWISDGGPKGWYGPGSTTKGEQYNGDTYYYPNDQRAATLWYHDHAMGITRINVYAGMAGFYILRDDLDDALSVPNGTSFLPRAPYEIPLVFQDRMFQLNANGTYSLSYPPPPEVPEFFGDTMTVNGVVWPRMKVEPRKYRFRLLNGCNARFLNMILALTDSVGTLPNNPVPATPFIQIGTDGGLLGAPVTVPKLLQAPAERCDVVIDFSQFKPINGVPQYLLLYNDASTPFGNTNKTAGAIKQVMLFEVSLPLNPNIPDPQTVPTVLDPGIQPIPLSYTNPNALQRQITLDEIVDVNGMLRQLLNMRGYETNSTYASLTVDKQMNNFLNYATPPANAAQWYIKLGSTEQWMLINTTVDVHPIHMHQAMFRIVSRQAFDANRYNKDRAALAPGAPALDINAYLMAGTKVVAAPNEQGEKDTVRANPGEVTILEATFKNFATPSFNSSDAYYVSHCHILEHEEHDMMLPLVIKP